MHMWEEKKKNEKENFVTKNWNICISEKDIHI